MTNSEDLARRAREHYRWWLAKERELNSQHVPGEFWEKEKDMNDPGDENDSKVVKRVPVPPTASIPSMSFPIDEGRQGKYERHPNSARFHELISEIAELHDRKQQDYGAGDDPFANVRSSQEFGVPAWVGALVRLNDKITRLKAFAQKGTLANESAADSMQDIAVYALIALVLYEQESRD